MKKPDSAKRLEDALTEANPDERDALRDMWRLSANADEIPNVSSEAVDALWQKLRPQAGTPPTQPAPPSFRKDRGAISRPHARSRFRVWAGSAVAVILLAIGISLWLRPLVKTAPYGEQLAVYLPDGSTVELNSGSSIKYPRFFTGNRNVALDGEAFFDVKESDVPFIVQTFNAEVQVLGTTFNVKAWPDGWRPESKVSLASGSIRLSAIENPVETMVMVPGQTVTVRPGPDGFVEGETDAIDRALAWREGALIFKDQRLEAVLEDVERRFGIDIQLNANRLLEKEVTFAYRNITTAENMIEDLCHALDLRYRPIANGYELFEE